MEYTQWFNALGMDDVERVGGKNASLGEMISHLTKAGVRVPDGFATTAEAYREFLASTGLEDKINSALGQLNVDDVNALAATGKQIRQWLLDTPLQAPLLQAITDNYRQLEAASGGELAVAVRSSATAEDLPDASFAGQQETFLNVCGLDNVLAAVKEVFASLYNDRAIAYRVHHGFDHSIVALSAGIQRMVRSDLAASGVMFTLDTESGFDDAVFITSSYGLGEMVVQGAVNPDEFYVYKPNLKKDLPAILRRNMGSKANKMVYSDGAQSEQGHDSGVVSVAVEEQERQCFSLSDDDIHALAKQALIIEQHYARPMDIEWGKDGIDGELYILQARPETVKSRSNSQTLKRYRLNSEPAHKQALVSGRSIGQRIGSGTAKVIADISEMDRVQPGDVLVTDMTDPNWEPIMKRASAIVTNRGGRTCFAGDTQLLTNEGFMSFAQLARRGHQGISVPSLNRNTLKIEWKPVLAVMKKTAQLVKVGILQTGRMQENTLSVTSDHKMLNLADAKLVDTELQTMLANDDAVLLAQQLPQLTSTGVREKAAAYLLGGLMSDGHIRVTRTKGEVTFIQKPTEAKQQFIKAMNTSLQSVYGKAFKAYKKQASSGYIRGQQVVGEANVYRCYSKSIAEELSNERDNLIVTLLKGDTELACYFLAGVIDGDGSFYQGRVNIYIGNDELLQAVVIACLRLGIVPQITVNRSIYNVQLVEQLDLLGRYTQRVACHDNRCAGTRFFNTKQLFSAEFDSNINNRVRKNLLIDEQAVATCLAQLPAEKSTLAQRLQTLLDSDIRQSRVRLVSDLGENEVYNITVADNHNYIVFSSRYSPVLVNNCHAAIIARELGIPAVVGCGNATEVIDSGMPLTVSCAEGDTGYVYSGALDFGVKEVSLENMPELAFKITMNVGNPDRAFDFSRLPNAGVGLARLEFIINRMIGVHPKALLNYAKLPPDVKNRVKEHSAGYADPVSFYVDKLCEGVATIAAAFNPKPVIVRLSDFKSNEYANLVGGELYEPDEENPMLGYRGASRYLSSDFRDCFELECQALKKVRDEMGLTNVELMVPFVRTLDEARQVIDLLAEKGLRRGENGLKIVMMCELPSNALLADEFLEYFDGFSIGSNDMTQLGLGLDRDSGLIAHLFDERDPAIKKLLHLAIQACRKQDKYVGICGQGPSDHPDLARWLMEEGIESVSLNPDSVVETWLFLANEEV